MEQILDKLSEIELTAKRVIQDSEQMKQKLSQEAEQTCLDFDRQLEAKTSVQIQEIRNGLEREKDAQLSALRADTDAAFLALDAYYEQNHKHLSRELFEKILDL